MNKESPLIRVGTRGSALAVAQTSIVINQLRERWSCLSHEDSLPISFIKTTGDIITDRPLFDIGGKALFTKEIDESLLAGEIDVGVNSLKDIPPILPKGIKICSILRRDDARDALISQHAIETLFDLPDGSIIGTTSLRRKALLLSQRPDLKIIPLRGNINSRLEKLKAEQYDAIVLACAGIKRLNLDLKFTTLPLAVEDFIPSAGQGALAITCRCHATADIERFFSVLHDEKTASCVLMERAFIQEMEGSCSTPLGAFACYKGEEIHFQAFLSDEYGKNIFRVERFCSLKESLHVAIESAREIKKEAPSSLLPAYQGEV